MNGTNQTGFIPDVVRLLEKYHLLDTLEVYRRDSIFPSKLSWKKTVKYKLREHELYLWHSRTSQPEFSQFHRVVPISQVHYVWILSKECPKLIKACKSVVQMIGSILDCDVQLCYKCNAYYHNPVDHCISECTYLHYERVQFWHKIYQFNHQVYFYFRSLAKVSLTSLLLGGEVRFDFIFDDNLCTFWNVVLSSLHIM